MCVPLVLDEQRVCVSGYGFLVDRADVVREWLERVVRDGFAREGLERVLKLG